MERATNWGCWKWLEYQDLCHEMDLPHSSKRNEDFTAIGYIKSGMEGAGEACQSVPMVKGVDYSRQGLRQRRDRGDGQGGRDGTGDTAQVEQEGAPRV